MSKNRKGRKARAKARKEITTRDDKKEQVQAIVTSETHIRQDNFWRDLCTFAAIDVVTDSLIDGISDIFD